ncbi:lipopolysaccharide heptosyltransferase family protein [candidate division KSB1 bacterium]|nr:MAG: lipopolysaccharide heptosyltransferase family protein [candidate division KSB1 bacterium]
MILRGLQEFPAPERVLLIQLRRIGDVLLGTPALRALSRRFPGVRVDFLVEPPADEVLWGHPLVDRLFVVPRDKSLRTFFRFTRLLRARRYDWVIDFFSNPRSAQFAFLSGARVRVGLDRRGRRWAYTHHIVEEETDRDAYAVDLRLDVLQRMGVPEAGRELEIFSDNAAPLEKARAAQILTQVAADKPLIVVNTGSHNPAKRYPADLTARTISELRRLSYEIILTSGPGETELGESILALLPQRVPFLPDARVPTLAALFRHAHLYLGPDSGPKHVAVACHLPTVTIFGPGRPSNWNDPHNPRNIVLTAPCDVRPHCIEAECARRECLRKIPPESVVNAVTSLLMK